MPSKPPLSHDVPEGMAPLTVKVPRQLLRELRLRCFQSDRAIQSFLEEAIREALGLAADRERSRK